MTDRIALIFHGIGTPARPLEPGEAPYWLSESQFKSILDQVASAPDRYVLTFDDGNASDHDIALPLMLGRGLTAQIFVLSGRLDQPGSLSRDHVIALQSAGMTIGSHGIAHRKLTALDDAALSAELSQSRAVLQDLCGRPVTGLGIPFGAYDARVLRAARRAGYDQAWSSDRGPMGQGFLRARTSFRGDMDAAQIRSILAGDMPAMARLRRNLGMIRRRWL